MATIVRLRDLGTTYSGLTGKTKADFGHGEARFVTFTGVMAAARMRDQSGLARVIVSPKESQNRVLRGDLLFNGTSETAEDVAFATVVEADLPPRTFLNSFCFGYRLAPTATEVSPSYLAYMFRGPQGRFLVAQLAQGFTRYNISKTKLMELEFEVPELSDQERIVAQLVDADEYVAAAEAIHRKQTLLALGVRESLLTGRSRLPGFSAPWQEVQISTLLTPRSERNGAGEGIEVLSCTKDRGFVRSLDYFKSQVFSRDLSGYLVIRRGTLGIPRITLKRGRSVSKSLSIRVLSARSTS
ncbi:hypothetical protein BW730_06910 [Tessaracoccus aquimaris]|uniref:Type I restriction modification DNA specificity domain-containing protein n=1 Tax=Tessaracoccus aquimaris TaxID=1332264 RepID=A0A1Q2CME3_9ACTN|nr:restriction endonuclease subunit S [Tessaracoccus aquimaris]AQP47271.1 hypothetical protein BW730_06910 [Tessaracoccus aquimaris]